MVKQPTKKALMKVAKGDIVPATDYEDIGFGPEDEVERHELSIPFYAILQSNSPEVEEQTIPGAKTGMIFNTVTKELYPDGIFVLPVRKDYQFVEWVPRTRGGGFVGLHDPKSEIVVDAIKANGGSVFGNLVVPSEQGDNDLVETKFMYVMHYDPHHSLPAGFGMISFSKTKIKPYNDWITSMQLIVPKVKHRVTIGAKIETYRQTNPKGTFSNYLIKPAGTSWKDSLMERPKMDAVLLEAKNFQDLIASGMVTADFASTKADGDDGEAPF